jgi:NTP pyrophosphatase (non-canonical NTP hydrolase)
VPKPDEHAVPDLPALATRLRAFAAARSWERHHTPRNLALALAGEVGELCAELQWEREDDPRVWSEDLRARVADEIADVLIYLVRFADVSGIDPLAAAAAKVERNATRFPPLP